MRRGICFAAVILLVFSTSAGFVCASDTSGAAVTVTNAAVVTGGAITVPGGAITATGKAINLSIKDAVKIMQTTGTRAETANLNKQSDEAIASGYSETVHTINETLNNLTLLDRYNPALAVTATMDAQEAGATKTNKEVSNLRRDFASTQIEQNYKAEMNQIEYDTLKVYYGVLLAQDNLKTEQNNLKTQQDILKNAKAQYQVGMLAKKDVLSAQSALTAAQSSIRAAETKLEYAKMSFNFLLGYPARQDVRFTDSLDVVSSSAIDIDASVKSAVANRNEIRGANFAVTVYAALLKSVDDYPKDSSTYLKKKIALLSAQKQAKDAPVQIEIDIRNKAAELEDKKAAMEAAKTMQAYAQEGYRLISISYDAGMTTLAELQQAQANVYKAGLGVSAAISDYDLAVYAFRYAQDVGVGRLPL